MKSFIIFDEPRAIRDTSSSRNDAEIYKAKRIAHVAANDRFDHLPVLWICGTLPRSKQVLPGSSVHALGVRPFYAYLSVSAPVGIMAAALPLVALRTGRELCCAEAVFECCSA
ncbi:MAG: hypothetical protein ACLT98_13930 [Eggerthellaceae bacterium]